MPARAMTPAIRAAATEASAAGVRIAPLPASSAVPRTEGGALRARDPDDADRRVAGARARQRVQRAGKREAVGAEQLLGVRSEPVQDVDGGQQLERRDLPAGPL
jgi:hypothetical protein